MICKHILLIKFLNEPKVILFHAVKWFRELLCITNKLFKHQTFVYIQLNDQTILYKKIQFSIGHLFTLILDVKYFFLT